MQLQLRTTACPCRTKKIGETQRRRTGRRVCAEVVLSIQSSREACVAESLHDRRRSRVGQQARLPVDKVPLETEVAGVAAVEQRCAAGPADWRGAVELRKPQAFSGQPCDVRGTDVGSSGTERWEIAVPD